MATNNKQRVNNCVNKTDITINTYDNIVSEYIDYFNSKGLNGGVQFQKEIDYITANLPDKARILDAGTAIGDYPKYLTEKIQKNYAVTGIDASKNMIEVAKKNAPRAYFEVMDIRDMSFPRNSFDAILCFATLIHVNDNDCRKILDSFDDMLSSDGLIAINVIEQLDDTKEIFIPEPFNTRYQTYFNRYKKAFFTNYLNTKGYQITGFFDNKTFNSKAIGGGEQLSASNQFSIIAKKPHNTER